MRKIFVGIIVLTGSFIFGYKIVDFYHHKNPKVLSIASNKSKNTKEASLIAALPTPSSIPAAEPTPTKLPTPTATSTPTPTPTSIPTATPTPTPEYSLNYEQEQVNGFIVRFSAQYGVDEHVLRHIAVCESGMNPLAVNGPYAGLFQFSSTTWQNNRALLGEDTSLQLRLDAEEAAQTAAYMLSIGRGDVWPNCVP